MNRNIKNKELTITTRDLKDLKKKLNENKNQYLDGW